MSGALDGRVIIITGAGSGIGRGILRAAIGADARATGLDFADDALDATRAEGADAIRADVRDPEALAAAIGEVRAKAGRLDGLVNNAGLTLIAPFLEADTDQWNTLWETNQRSVLAGCQAAARIMVADGKGGALVNIASVHANSSDQGYEAYAGTKGAIVAMGRAMAWSLGAHGIRVNTLSPGLTMTETVAKAAQEPGNADKFLGWHATGKVSTVGEIGDLAVFLLSDASSALTGAEIIADQGTTARLCNLEA